MKNIIYVLITTLVLLLTSFPCFAQEFPASTAFTEEIGKVTELIREEKNDDLQVFGQNNITQIVKIKVLTGELEGQEFVIENLLSNHPAYDIRVKEGDKVLLHIEKDLSGEPIINIDNLYRSPSLAILACLFAILVIALGGKKGIKALLTLVIIYLLLLYILIPGILANYPPILLTILVSLVATCGTLFIIAGPNLKTVSAIIGTVGGVSTAGLISYLTIIISPLTGLPSEEAIGLWTSDPNLNYRGILASAMIIGALGASMDVGISIASSTFEVKKAKPDIKTRELVAAGMNVGKDIMGAMTNTLLLAYTGSAMFLLLLAYNNISFIKFVNLDSIASEITAALTGSIGLVMCIPITAVVSGHLYNLNKKKETP